MNSDTRPARTKIVMIPSVGGGIGHISRTASLAKALWRIDPELEIEYLLDTDRLRPFNIEATRRMGFRPRFLPPRSRENREAVVRACLDDAHLVVDDCSRYLLPLRRAVPEVGWVTLAMHPLGDELFMDWPFLVQMDAVIWPYAPLVAMPAELDCVKDKVVQTGPFLDTDGLPGKAEARRRLRWAGDAPTVLYAPRGFPFGREFGHKVLAGLYGGMEALRRGAHPGLRLVLLAVSQPADLKGIAGVPEELPDWVEVKGVVTPGESLLHIQAADAVVGEGTSTMHEAAAVRTPLVVVPGPITEATLLAQALGRAAAAAVIPLAQAAPAAFAKALGAALTDGAPLDRQIDVAHGLITGGGGADAAARVVLNVAKRAHTRVGATG